MVTDNEAIEPAPDNEGPADSMGAAALGLKTPEEAQQESTEQRQALVKKILADIQAREEHFKPEFEKMRRNVRFVKNRDGEQWKGVDGIGPHNLKDKYVANVTHQLIRSKVSSLYARNPRARARRRPMVDYVVWDGRQETLSTAIQTVMGPMQAMQAVGAAQMGAPGAWSPAAAGARPHDGPHHGHADRDRGRQDPAAARHDRPHRKDGGDHVPPRAGQRQARLQATHEASRPPGLHDRRGVGEARFRARL
jgi:hypothetical protein